MLRRRFLVTTSIPLSTALLGCLGPSEPDDEPTRSSDSDPNGGGADDGSDSEDPDDAQEDTEGDERRSAADPDHTTPLAQFQYDPQNAGVADASAPDDPDVDWLVEHEATDAGCAASDSCLVVTSNDEVTAFDADDGAERWSAAVSGRHESTPTLTADTAYVPAWGPKAEYGVTALALDDGAVRWQALPDAGVGTAPTLANDAVFVGGSLDSSLVVALDAESGEELWRTELGRHATTPAVDDGSVYVGGGQTQAVVALDESDGDRLWRVDTDDEVFGAPTVHDGTVYVGVRDGTVLALDADAGDEQWRTDVDSDVPESIAVTDDALYVPGENELTALDHDGGRLWSVDVSSRAHAPTAASDRVVFTDRKELVCVDRDDGTERWRRGVQERVDYDAVYSGIRSPPFVSDGAAYVVSQAGDVYRFV